ncbi:MAG: prepilin-type N-terminal cleavage/methylation domain-containing protein [Sumerlaeia bacterium]
MKPISAKGVSLLELLVVVLVVSILSTIAVGVYSRELIKSKAARARAEISALEVAITRYQLDTGQYPPSGTSGGTFNFLPATDVPYQGSGSLYGALMRGVLENAVDSDAEVTPLWQGPYIDFRDNTGVYDFPSNTVIDPSVAPSGAVYQTQFLDPFKRPYYYIRSTDYDTLGGTLLPASDPLFTIDQFYNPSTFQLVSFGPDGQSTVNSGLIGTDPDDLSNWTSSQF